MIQLKAFFLLGLLSTFSGIGLAQANFSTYNQDTDLLGAPGFYPVRNRQSSKIDFVVETQLGQGIAGSNGCRAGYGHECNRYWAAVTQLNGICEKTHYPKACNYAQELLRYNTAMGRASIKVE